MCTTERTDYPTGLHHHKPRLPTQEATTLTSRVSVFEPSNYRTRIVIRFFQ
jgi:hypothetical protein